MHYLIICTAAFLVSGLTLFSGFGLGTLLLPVMALFFPIDAAIALTAIVHCLNNLFKFALLGRHADQGHGAALRPAGHPGRPPGGPAAPVALPPATAAGLPVSGACTSRCSR